MRQRALRGGKALRLARTSPRTPRGVDAPPAGRDGGDARVALALGRLSKRVFKSPSRVWLAIIVASIATALALAVSTGSLVAGVFGGLMLAAVGAAVFAAVYMIVAKDTRLPLSTKRSLPAGSAIAVVALVLLVAVARETFFAMNVYHLSSNVDVHSSSQVVNDARAPLGAVLDPATGPFHDAFFAACGCREERNAPSSAFAVTADVPSACWIPFVKPLATKLHAEAGGGATHFALDVDYQGTMVGFVSTRACERLVGEALGERYRLQLSKWRK